MAHPDFEVVWSGAMRRYLSPALRPLHDPPTPTTEPEPFDPPQTPGQTAPEARGWLGGEHLQSYDVPRQRLAKSLATAPGAFTTRQLAAAARVSVTMARGFLGECERAEMVRQTGERPVGRTKELIYERV